MEAAENSLVQTSFGALAHFHGSPTGLQFERDFADLDEFKSYCESLAKVRSFGPFAVGDGFLKAVAQFGEKKAMGDTLVAVTGHTAAWVRKCTEVANAIPYQYRLMTSRYMSFEHHAAAAKYKGNGCETHAGNVVSDKECEACRDARYQQIAELLAMAEKKKWSAKELKDHIAQKSTTVREHQRNLDGAEFDPEPILEAVGAAKDAMTEIKNNVAGLIVKSKFVNKQGKKLHGRIEKGEAALSDLRKLIEAQLG